MSSADDRDSESSAAPKKPTTAEKISVLCRIFRAAVKSGDAELRDTTARELGEYGVQLGDLIVTKPDRSKWNELKLRTALYWIKCCPSCGHEDLCPRATGPTWSCQKCNVRFTVTNPSYLKRKGKA